jgi:Zn-dependent protease with chaperone function
MCIVYTLELYVNNILGNLLILAFGLISLISFIYMIIYFSFDSRRFWLQIDEIYCDRKACDLCGVEPEYVADALKEISSDMENYPRKKWYDRLYISYYMILEHPCLKYRIKLMENYRKWNVSEYIRHLNVMFIWLITGRGWIGE